MPAPPVHIEPVNIAADPMTLAAAWPADRALTMLHSARTHPRWARWSILAEPARRIVAQPDAWPGQLAEIFDQPDVPADHRIDVPFLGGWIGYLTYELGRSIEPAARHDHPPRDDRGWPLFEFAWCPNALLYDRTAQRWWAIGDVADLLAAIGVHRSGALRRTPAQVESDRAHEVGPLTSSLSTDAYLDAVRRIIEYLRAGDIYQANLTQRLSCTFAGSMRRLFPASISAAQPWFGALLELEAGTIISQSPELFLDVRAATSTVTTRPIKGTRPADQPADDLLHSEKDAAELNMIVDLMRNDMSRVCAFGSVKVAHGRRIESHPTVHHGVAEISGRLRDECSLVDLIRATFPAGSITGAPKIRAMQIIEELEPVRRGPYCGAVGCVDRRGNASFSVAIRTIARRAGTDVLDYGVGGGIVIDSEPESELDECAHKAAVFENALAALAAESVQAGNG